MISKQTVRMFTALLCMLLIFSAAAHAGVATDRIKHATDKLTGILSNHDLDPPEMAEKRARMIRETVDEVFDWKAFSQRAMGKHWKKLNKDEKKEFEYLFGKLIEKTYMDKTRQYSGEKITFLNEEMDEKYGCVKAKVTANNGADIGIEFHVVKRKNGWYIYDLYIEGVSLVKNYRVQFNNIMIKSNYPELLKKLKTKVDN